MPFVWIVRPGVSNLGCDTVPFYSRLRSCLPYLWIHLTNGKKEFHNIHNFSNTNYNHNKKTFLFHLKKMLGIHLLVLMLLILQKQLSSDCSIILDCRYLPSNAVHIALHKIISLAKKSQT